MTSMTSIPTGEEYYKGRRQSIQDLYDRIDNVADEDYDRASEITDDAQTELDELPLSVDVEKHVVIVLGTGGPHDEIDYNVTTGQARYNYYWGSERLEQPIYSGDPMYRLAEYYAEIIEAGE